MPRLRSRAPQTNPCTEVVYWSGTQYLLTRVAVSHLRQGDFLFGVNQSGEVFRRTVTDVVPAQGNAYVYLNVQVRPTSEFPLSAPYTTDVFLVRGDMIIGAFLIERALHA